MKGSKISTELMKVCGERFFLQKCWLHEALALWR
jgi:hypothetical protein